MVERRPLTEGLKVAQLTEPGKEKEFVFGAKTNGAVTTHLRVSINTRVRDDFAKGLKRASLERKLQGVEPNTLQDILEEAIEPWLKAHGYLT